MLSPGGARGVEKAELNGTLIQTTTTEASQGHMYYIGLDVHRKAISYCVKDASGQAHQEGKIGATRWELDDWMKTLPQPWTVAAFIIAGATLSKKPVRNQPLSPSFFLSRCTSRSHSGWLRFRPKI